MNHQTSNTHDSLRDAISSTILWGDYQREDGSWGRGIANLDAIMQLIEAHEAAAVQAARVDELNNLPLEGLLDQCFIAFRKRIDKRLATLRGKE